MCCTKNGDAFWMPDDRLPRTLRFGRVKGDVCEGTLGLVSVILCCATASHAALVDLTRMLRIGRSGKTRLALHAPKLIMSWPI